MNADSSQTTLPSALEAFLGLSAGSVLSFVQSTSDFPDTDAPIEGSAIGQSFTGNVGDVLSFDWNFFSDDICCAFDDRGFLVLDGGILLLGKSSTATETSNLFRAETGYNSFSITLTTSGNHFIGIGVIDNSDPVGNSAILVDNFRLTPRELQPVPEPSTFVLFGIGILGLIGYRKLV